jgi:hypothetical protein
MVGARTEAAPTAAVADTRTAAALMEAAGRVTPAAAEDISPRVDRAAAGRRDIRQWRDRVAARMEARRHGSRVAIPRVRTAGEATLARAEAMAAGTATRAGRLMATADTEALDTETRAATVVQRMAQTAELMAARVKAGRTATRMETTLTGIRATGAAVTALARTGAVLE